jgi:hypothetical protein
MSIDSLKSFEEVKPALASFPIIAKLKATEEIIEEVEEERELFKEDKGEVEDIELFGPEEVKLEIEDEEGVC